MANRFEELTWILRNLTNFLVVVVQLIRTGFYLCLNSHVIFDLMEILPLVYLILVTQGLPYWVLDWLKMLCMPSMNLLGVVSQSGLSDLQVVFFFFFGFLVCFFIVCYDPQIVLLFNLYYHIWLGRCFYILILDFGFVLVL